LYFRQLQAGFDPDRGTEFGPCRFARELGGLHPLCPPNLERLRTPKTNHFAIHFFDDFIPLV
jgi:hypothetical protein